MELDNKLAEIFEDVSQNSDFSLDEILAECFNRFLNTSESSQEDLLASDFDLFRKSVLNVCGINEYDYYTKNVNSNLKQYIEQNIFPEYEKNDKAHGIVHIKEVIRRSFALNQTLKLGLDDNMIFATSACHDWGKYIDHETHEKIAAQNFWLDQNMKNFFSDEERQIIKEAIEDHRSSFEDTPRSDYGKLISSADRNTRIEIVFVRSFNVGKWRTPEMTIEDFLEFTHKRLSKRYSVENPENMFFEDDTYRQFLHDMRQLLNDEKEFKDRYCIVNKIDDRSKTVGEA